MYRKLCVNEEMFVPLYKKYKVYTSFKGMEHATIYKYSIAV